MIHPAQNAPTFHFKQVRLAAFHVGLVLRLCLVDGIGDVICFALVDSARTLFFCVGSQLGGGDRKGQVDRAADRLEEMNVRLGRGIIREQNNRWCT